MKNVFYQTNENFGNSKELKDKLNKISIKFGFSLIKDYGWKNDVNLVFICEYGGRKRESKSTGNGKNLPKN